MKIQVFIELNSPGGEPVVQLQGHFLASVRAAQAGTALRVEEEGVPGLVQGPGHRPALEQAAIELGKELFGCADQHAVGHGDDRRNARMDQPGSYAAHRVFPVHCCGLAGREHDQTRMVLMEQLAKVLGRYPVLVAVPVLKQEPALLPVRSCRIPLDGLAFPRWGVVGLTLSIAKHPVPVKVDDVHLGQPGIAQTPAQGLQGRGPEKFHLHPLLLLLRQGGQHGIGIHGRDL